MSDYSVPINRQALHSRKIARARVLQWVLATIPTLFTMTLIVLAWRASALIGHWPQAWIDDPKYVPPDRVFDWLYDLVFLMGLLNVVNFVMFPVLFVLMWKYTTMRQRLAVVSVVLLGFGLYFLIGSELLTWYFD